MVRDAFTCSPKRASLHGSEAESRFGGHGHNEDESNKAKIEAVNALKNYCFTMRNTMLIDNFEGDDKNKIDKAVQKTLSWLESEINWGLHGYPADSDFERKWSLHGHPADSDFGRKWSVHGHHADNDAEQKWSFHGHPADGDFDRKLTCQDADAVGLLQLTPRKARTRACDHGQTSCGNFCLGHSMKCCRSKSGDAEKYCRSTDTGTIRIERDQSRFDVNIKVTLDIDPWSEHWRSQSQKWPRQAWRRRKRREYVDGSSWGKWQIAKKKANESELIFYDAREHEDDSTAVPTSGEDDPMWVDDPWLVCPRAAEGAEHVASTGEGPPGLDEAEVCDAVLGLLTDKAAEPEVPDLVCDPADLAAEPEVPGLVCDPADPAAEPEVPDLVYDPDDPTDPGDSDLVCEESRERAVMQTCDLESSLIRREMELQSLQKSLERLEGANMQICDLESSLTRTEMELKSLQNNLTSASGRGTRDDRIAVLACKWATTKRVLQSLRDLRSSQ